MISRKIRALVARLGLEHPSQLSALDWLDRVLLLVMWSGGFLLAAHLVSTAVLTILLFPESPAKWISAVLVVGVALCLVRFSSTIPPAIASRDPRSHPALRSTVLFIAICLVVVAFLRGAAHIVTALRGDPLDWWSAAFEFGLAILGVQGVRQLLQRWPNARLGYQSRFSKPTSVVL